MPKNTDRCKRIAPILCAAAVIALLLAYVTVFLFSALGMGADAVPAVIFLIIAVLALLTVIGGVVLALRQRLKEIESGEEEDAKKY